VYRSGGRDAPGIKFNLAEGALVVRNILLQDCSQSLCLLRAQIDSLKISHFHLALGLLLHGSKHKKEVPDVHPHLNAIGICLAVVFGVDDGKIGLRGDNHTKVSLAGMACEWLGGSVLERMVQLTSSSTKFRELMRDLFSGAQEYSNLKQRVYRSLPTIAAEALVSTLWRSEPSPSETAAAD